MNVLRRVTLVIVLGMVGAVFIHSINDHFFRPILRLFQGDSTSEGHRLAQLKSAHSKLPGGDSSSQNSLEKEKLEGEDSKTSPPSLPFDADWIGSLESEEIKERLAHVGSEDPRRLVEDLNHLILQLDSAHIQEKQKLMQLSHYFEGAHQLGISKEVYLQEADRYFDSENSAVSGYGRQALDYAIALETDPEKQEERRVRFNAAHPAAVQQSVDNSSDLNTTENSVPSQLEPNVEQNQANLDESVPADSNRAPAGEPEIEKEVAQ